MRAARQHDRMTFLGLQTCGIGPAGAKEIADYIQFSGVLNKLDVRVNWMRNEGERVLQDAVKGRVGFKLLV